MFLLVHVDLYILVVFQMSVQTNISACVVLIILLHYFHLTNFFWMFVEGEYNLFLVT